MISKQFRTTFASIPLKAVVSEETDKFLSIASMDVLKSYVPKIDSRNIDLLPVAFDACVINRGNKNGDIMNTDTALSIYKTFENKFIDCEHSRTKVIGFILKANLTEFGTNKILTEEEVKGTDKPFYITLGGVLWRAVNGDLCDLVEDSNDRESDNYMAVSASWELGFSGYDVVEFEQGKKNLSEGTIIKDPETIKKVEKCLKCFGGSGVMNGKSYYRMPNENVIAMGIGLTEKPAAEVKGVAVKEDEKPATTDAKAEVVAEAAKNNLDKEIENISQTQQTTVKEERTTIMKITSIADITDDSLKQCTASVVTEFLNAELKKASEAFTVEKANQASAATKAQQTTQSLIAKLDEMKASLDALAAEKAAREKVDTFNSRMAEIVASYELPDDVAQVVADDLKNIGTTEAYASWKTKAATLLKSFDKVAIAAAKKAKKAKDDEEEMAAKAKKEKADKEAEAAKAPPFKKDDDKKDDKKDDDKDDKKKDAKASEAVASAVEGAIDNADKKDGGLPNTSSAAAPSLKEKYKQAFGEEGFVVKNVR